MMKLATAFETAGWRGAVTAQDRLNEMMRMAINEGGAGRPERVSDYFLAALVRANDATLVWELFAPPVRTAAIRLLFDKVKAGMPKPQNVVEDAAVSAVPQGQILSAPSSAAEVTGAVAVVTLPQGLILPAPSPVPTQRPSLLRYERRDTVRRLSVLQTFKINGLPLAEVTGAEMRGWLRNQRRDSHFIGLIDQHVVIPDDVRIGAIVPPELADDLFREATERHNDV